MTEPTNVLTSRVLAEMRADAEASPVLHVPREHALQLIDAALAAYAAGIVPEPAEWVRPPAPPAREPK